MPGLWPSHLNGEERCEKTWPSRVEDVMTRFSPWMSRGIDIWPRRYTEHRRMERHISVTSSILREYNRSIRTPKSKAVGNGHIDCLLLSREWHIIAPEATFKTLQVQRRWYNILRILSRLQQSTKRNLPL